MSWIVRKTGDIGEDSKPGAYEATMHWQVIWPRAIAKAWHDADFHQQLKDDPRKAILDHFQYELSDELNLTIKDAEAGQFVDVEKGDPFPGLPHLELTMYIPPAPAADLQAVAITTYEDTGRTYPFTCC